jgi:pilus assembly protein CpaE
VTLFDRKLGSKEEVVLDLSQHRIELVLSRAEVAQLESPEVLTTGMAIAVNQLEPDMPLPEEIARRARILCIEVKPGLPASIDRIARLRREHPDVHVIAAARNADIALVRALLRQGVRDVVELPVATRQLSEAVGDILAEIRLNPHKEGRQGQFISIVKSIGGVGATNVGVNLATALANQGSACLFDLDVQFGNAATYIGAQTSPSLSELLEGGARIDADFLNTVTATLPSGLNFVPPPQEIGPLEAIDEAQLQRILRVARAEFDYVIADMPANWANWTLSAVAQSDLIILVVNLTIASLRQGRRQLQLLRSQGIEAGRIAILVNRVEQRLFKSIGLEDAAKALGHPADLFVHNDYALMNAANNQGIVVSELNPRSKVARDFARIAESVPALVSRKG